MLRHAGAISQSPLNGDYDMVEETKIKRRIGSDPEFSLYDTERRRWRSASRFLSTMGPLGHDGRAATGEMRPAPGLPDAHLKHVRAGIRALNFLLPAHIEPWAGAWCEHALGGHIHLERPGLGAEPDWIIQQLNALLDTCVGLPLLLTEPESTASRRRQIGYGGPSDYRLPSHGLEYRMPSSWLSSPARAAFVLYVGGAINTDLDWAFNTLEPILIGYREARSVPKMRVLARRWWGLISENLRRIARRYPEASPYIGWMLDAVARGRECGPACLTKAWRVGDQLRIETDHGLEPLVIDAAIELGYSDRPLVGGPIIMYTTGGVKPEIKIINSQRETPRLIAEQAERMELTITQLSRGAEYQSVTLTPGARAILRRGEEGSRLLAAIIRNMI